VPLLSGGQFYDEDRAGDPDLRHHDFIGEASLSLGTLVASPGQQAIAPLRHASRSRSGEVIIKAEEVAACADWLHVTFMGKKLANKDGFFGKSDPFYVIKKGERMPCHFTA
jgi:hypothetical protein